MPVSLRAIARGEATSAFARGEPFSVALLLVQKTTAPNPCLSDDGAPQCTFSVGLTDGGGAHWEVRVLVWDGYDETSILVVLAGNVPQGAGPGPGIVRVTLLAPTHPYPVFSHTIPVTVQ